MLLWWLVVHWFILLLDLAWYFFNFVSYFDAYSKDELHRAKGKHIWKIITKSYPQNFCLIRIVPFPCTAQGLQWVCAVSFCAGYFLMVEQYVRVELQSLLSSSSPAKELLPTPKHSSPLRAPTVLQVESIQHYLSSALSSVLSLTPWRISWMWLKPHLWH